MWEQVIWEQKPDEGHKSNNKTGLETGSFAQALLHASGKQAFLIQISTCN